MAMPHLLCSHAMELLAGDEEVMASVLGFRRAGGGWELALAEANGGIIPYVTGVLLADLPERFASAAGQIIRDASVRGFYQMAPFLRDARDRLPQPVLDALVERTRLMDLGMTAEPEVLFLLAQISPERLVREPWERLEEWLPQARAALADALALAGRLMGELAECRGRLFARLIGDGLFGVRRAAYRALAEVDPRLLANLCSRGQPWKAMKRRRSGDGLPRGPGGFRRSFSPLQSGHSPGTRSRPCASPRRARRPTGASESGRRTASNAWLMPGIPRMSTGPGRTAAHSKNLGMTGASSGSSSRPTTPTCSHLSDTGSAGH